MSIWTDLLFLHGHIATPTGLAAVAPDAVSSAVAPTPRPAGAPAATSAAPPPRSTGKRRRAARPSPELRPNKISPNDLW